MEGSARYEDFSVVKSGISRWFVPASATLPGDLCSGDKPHSSADLISLRPIQFSTTRHARYCPYVSALARYHHESLWLKLPIGSYSPSRQSPTKVGTLTRVRLHTRITPPPYQLRSYQNLRKPFARRRGLQAIPSTSSSDLPVSLRA